MSRNKYRTTYNQQAANIFYTYQYTYFVPSQKKRDDLASFYMSYFHSLSFFKFYKISFAILLVFCWIQVLELGFVV